MAAHQKSNITTLYNIVAKAFLLWFSLSILLNTADFSPGQTNITQEYTANHSQLNSIHRSPLFIPVLCPSDDYINKFADISQSTTAAPSLSPTAYNTSNSTTNMSVAFLPHICSALLDTVQPFKSTNSTLAEADSNKVRNDMRQHQIPIQTPTTTANTSAFTSTIPPSTTVITIKPPSTTPSSSPAAYNPYNSTTTMSVLRRPFVQHCLKQ